MRRFKALSVALMVPAIALPTANASVSDRTEPDCRFDGAHSYESFGRIRVFTTDAGLFGCLTDVGRAHRLETGTLRARSAATRRAVFGLGDWVGFPTRTASGTTRVRALNLRSGAAHGARSTAAASALVVNYDGTLAWIAGTALKTKAAGGSVRTLGSDPGIDRDFLGLELEGCAVTWKVAGGQRSSSIYCKHP